ncbi:uncharacterized protein J3D65DRAFT_627355 [Phyllosticta citribraziliensis]|uniref:Uncharacterized protein n=1 Tax=Phyllosticta citribraziliensis TaxID=989973 RepID=A0ABR1LQ00_9PEZI
MSLTTLLENGNLSIAAIPAYYLLAQAPHAAALIYTTNGKVSKWENVNPKGEATKTAINKKIGPQRYAVYERLKAAHANCMENMPLFIAAIVFGNMAGLHKVEGSGGLNWFAGSFLLARAGYNIVYALNATQGQSYLRTLFWLLSVGQCFRVLFTAASILV